MLATDAPFWEGKMGSHQRILAIAKALKNHCSLKIFFFGSIGLQRRTQIKEAGFENMVVSYKDFDQHLKPEEAGLPKLTSFANIQGLKKRRHDAFYTTFAQYVAAVQPNIVLIEYIYLAYLQDAIPSNCLKLIDTHDVMCFREYRFYQHQMLNAISMSVSYQEEQFILNHFDAVLAIQKNEYEILRKMLPNKVLLLCPHSVTYDSQYRKLNEIKNIGFIGADNEANYSGLDWFIKQVWPIVKQLNLNLYIFGKVGDRFAGICDADESIKNMSDQLSQAEVYSLVDCMINPVFVGGGLKIKTLEALAYGKPLISSKEGSVGIDNQAENGIIVAHNRLEFIESLIKLVKQPNLATELIQQGQTTIEQQFSPESCYQPLINLISYC
ncbi:MAG: glycosyltransferase family 4 protein [Pleurocapsa minor HA4230-MV1]|nr:glycosyltransferase family 4 protein [Pleurocapsa minor HA4230-MV1]